MAETGGSMADKAEQATALMWCGNPNKWFGSGTMEAYIADGSQYIYWATPPRQCSHDQIRTGKRAYIWRTASAAGPRGIIAIGTITEEPRHFSPDEDNAHLFARPSRLNFGEEAA